jgi:hypothetical protein
MDVPRESERPHPMGAVDRVVPALELGYQGCLFTREKPHSE